ncbi:YtxH domain-containing protein [Compostibacter hankyongensis]
MSNAFKVFAGFIAGAAVGVAAGYLLNSDKKEEWIESLKDYADEWKEKADEWKEKAKEKAKDWNDKAKRKKAHVNDAIEDAIAG